MSRCKIYLENYSGTYNAGGEIRGRVECYFDDETTLRGIKIRLKCKEHNTWTGTETYTDSNHKTRTRFITLTGNRYVLYFEQMLFGSDSGSRVLSRGKYVYPFSFVLPHDVPSSYNGPYGYIAYKVKAVVDRPMRIDYEDNFDFTVVSPIDFNRKSKDLQEVTTYSDDKTVCCWCCQDGVITMDVELPKLAFVPGEVIDLKVTVSNLSNSNVDSLKVNFTETIRYKVTSPKTRYKEDISEIISLNEHGVGAHGEHTYDLQLAIPEYLVVPNFTNCELFKVNYQLEVSCQMPACTLDLDISVNNIELGHIQYYDGTSQLPDTTYPPPGASYPPAGGAYLSPAGGTYPPPAGGTYLPSTAGSYSPALYPAGAPASGNSLEKSVYPGGVPTAPTSSIANAPTSSIASAPTDDNPRAREAASSIVAPYESPSEPPPPSYEEAQQNTSPYPP